MNAFVTVNFPVELLGVCPKRCVTWLPCLITFFSLAFHFLFAHNKGQYGIDETPEAGARFHRELRG